MAAIDFGGKLATQIVKGIRERLGAELPPQAFTIIMDCWQDSFANSVLQRLVKEHGELSAANFALDILADTQDVLIQRVGAQLEGAVDRARTLQERLVKEGEISEELRKQLDPKRGERFNKRRKSTVQ